MTDFYRLGFLPAGIRTYITYRLAIISRLLYILNVNPSLPFLFVRNLYPFLPNNA